MAVRKRHIAVPPGSIKTICEALNVSRACVYNALNYSTNSDLARQIRDYAVENIGGRMATRIVW